MNINNVKSQKRFLMGAIAGIGTICVVAGYFQFYRIPYAKKQILDQVKKDNGSLVWVWKVNKELKHGTELKYGSNIEAVQEPLNKIPKNAIKSKDSNGNLELAAIKKIVVRINLGERTILEPGMLTPEDVIITDDLKRQDFAYFKLNSGLKGGEYFNDKGERVEKKGDYVDVRIRRKDGTDDIVLSKKYVVAISGQTVTMDLQEQERLLLDYATVEAALINAELYTVKYPDPQNQEDAVVTYAVSDKVKSLIETNPNIVKKSEDKLQEQQRTKTDNQNGYVNSDTGSKDNTQGPANNGKPEFRTN